ncbi:MAG: SET domain-containing protein, partial [Planctomycetota bacterium]
LVLSWDHARFVNHSCDPNCIGAWMDFEMAIRDIHPGEELTDDYGALNIETTFDCMCRTPQCRGRVSPEDVLQLWPRWDATLHQVIPTIGDVKQPLWNILTPEVRAEVENAIANPGMIPSVKGHFYPTQWSPVAPGGGNGSQPPAAIA